MLLLPVLHVCVISSGFFCFGIVTGVVLTECECGKYQVRNPTETLSQDSFVFLTAGVMFSQFPTYGVINSWEMRLSVTIITLKQLSFLMAWDVSHEI